jgi:two-component system response regulator NreC
MTAIRIILIEDHKVVRAGLRALFEPQSDIAVVAEADTAQDGWKAAQAERPDLVILDLTLPGGGSLKLIEQLLTLTPAPRVLVLTMHDDPAYARSAFAAGASGYVVKTVSEQNLLTAVRAIQRGQIFVDLDDPEKTAQVMHPARFAVRGSHQAAIGQLSDRELEVLRLLGQGHTNQAIAEQLDISPKTVATYRARIAEKLGLKTTADFVKYAADTGVLNSPGELR